MEQYSGPEALRLVTDTLYNIKIRGINLWNIDITEDNAPNVTITREMYDMLR